MTEWHTWDAVRDELGDSLGSSFEQTQRIEQLRRELALLRLVQLRKRSGLVSYSSWRWSQDMNGPSLRPVR